MDVPQLLVKLVVSLNVRDIVNVISHKSMKLFLWKEEGDLEHASENVFEFTPSITPENAPLAIRANATFIIYLVLLSSFSYIYFTE